MITPIRRALLRLRIHIIGLDIAQAEAAHRDIEARLEELARAEIKLRQRYTATLPIGQVHIWPEGA